MKNHAALNRIYRLVWSRVNNCWVAVAETAKGKGKSKTQRKLAALIVALLPAMAWAGLEGGVIVGGQGVIVNPNLVQQNSSSLAINAQAFSVGVGEIFTINQNLATDLALIRVLGQNPSNILGSINAKGQLFVSNPNGVLFGLGAEVNVGGLVATSLDISSDDFMAGNITFYNKAGAGSVVNKGNLTAAEGGYIALLAPEVRNEGIISATLGTALLASGDQITLTLNNGVLVDYNIDKGTFNGLVENKHLIQADGGQVFMSGKAADALTTSVVNNTGILRARTVQNQAGVIKLMGDMQSGTVNVGGTLDASAPAELNPNGGNGGFIETSAAHVKVADGTHVTTLAANGESGTWLIDPQDYIIGAGGDITGATLTLNLGLGNVSILSSGGGTAGNGDIFVNEDVSWSANNLTLTAARDINVNAVMTASGTSTLALNPATANGADAAVAGGTVKMGFNPDGTFKGRIDLPGRSGAGIVSIGGLGYTVINSLGAAGSVTGTDLQGINGGLAGRYVLGDNIDASATSGWNGGLGFAPISTFTGSFDGFGHTINALTINRPAVTSVGLFGTASNANIRNIGLEDASISGLSNTAGLVGNAIGATKITNSYATGTVSSGGNQVGGLVGLANGSSSITGSYAAVAVSGAYGTGGLVGLTGNTASIVGSHATGTVNGTVNYTGGLVGTWGSTSVLNLSNTLAGYSYATGNVTGAGAYTGGLVGDHTTGTINITDNTVTGNVVGGSYVGGLVGRNIVGTLNISNSTAGSVTGSLDYVGGLVGSATTANISSSYVTNAVSGRDYVGGLVGSAAGTTSITGSHATGTVNGRSRVGGLVGNWASSSVLNLSNTLAGYSYATGNVTGTGGQTGGLIGAQSGATTNINITDNTATGNLVGVGYTGGLVGNNLSGTLNITNSTAGSVTSTGDRTGGLVGNATTANINDSYVTNAVSGTNNTGGLVGYAAGTTSITGSRTTGAVSGTGFSVGGLVGTAAGNASIIGSHATGTIVGTGNVGGLVGTWSSDSVLNLSNTLAGYSYATGNVSSSSATGTSYGGLIGNQTTGTTINITDNTATGNVTGNSNVGGLVGTNASGSTLTITNSTAASVTGTGNSVGGLVGNAATANISNSYVTNAVSGNDYVGGLVGSAAGTTSITGSYVTGAVTGRDEVGGLVGRYGSSATLNISGSDGTDNYATGDVTGRSYVGGLVGRQNLGTINIDNNLNISGTAGSVTAIGTGFRIGGLVGLSSGGTLNINDSDAGAVTGNANSDYIGGLVGSIALGAITNSRYTQDISGGSYVGGITGYTGAFANVSNSYVIGDITGAGNGFVGGLIGMSLGAISNSYATGNVTGVGDVGGLVGHVGGPNAVLTGQNYATGNVSASGSGVGGLIGYHLGTATLNLSGSDGAGSYATGNVTGLSQVGGLVGIQAGGTININNNLNASGTAGSVTGLDGGQYVGGLVGQNNGGTLNIEKSTVGNVTASSTSDYVGGLVGSTVGGSVLHSYYMQNISGRSYLGGLVGESGAASNITESFASGNVTSAGGTAIGGLVGSNAGAITDAYATGATGGSGSTVVGGLVGDNAGGTITRTYATGAVSGSSDLGGLVGTNTGTVADSYWDTQTSGQLASAGGTGKTTAEMKSAATYSAWNIDDIGGTGNTWRIYNGSTAPLLRYFLTPITATLTGSGVYQYDGLVHTASNLGISYNVDPTTTTPNYSNQPGTQHLFESNAQNAGNYALLYSNQLGYDIDFAAAKSITITPAPLTVTANNYSKFYDGTNYTGGNGVGYNGFVNGETSAVLGGNLVYGGNSQGAVSPGLYSITPFGLSASNYNLTYVDGALQIEPRTLAEATPGYTGAVNSGGYYNNGQTSTFNNPQYGTMNACAPGDAYVRLSDQRFALTEVSSFELDGNGALALSDEVNVETIASNELTVTMLNGGTRYPDNRTGIARGVDQIKIVKLPSIVLLEGVK